MTDNINTNVNTSINTNVSPPEDRSSLLPLSAYTEGAVYEAPEGYEVPEGSSSVRENAKIYGIKCDTRTDNSILLSFVSVERDTQKAILLTVVDQKSGEVIEEWFPKSVCSNLDTVSHHINVWDKFMKDQKPYLILTEEDAS